MNKQQEPQDRQAYRRKCKHYSYNQCIARSGWDANGFHYNMACTGHCQRMERYDREQGLAGDYNTMD